MTKVEMLFIRACKSEDSLSKLRSLFNRFYLKQSDSSQIDRCLNSILSGVVDNHSPMSVSDYLIGCERERSYYTFDGGDAPEEYEITLAVLISKIRYTATSELNGYIVPARWRNK